MATESKVASLNETEMTEMVVCEDCGYMSLSFVCLFISTHSHSTMYITVQQENSGKLERVRKG